MKNSTISVSVPRVVLDERCDDDGAEAAGRLPGLGQQPLAVRRDPLDAGNPIQVAVEPVGSRTICCTQGVTFSVMRTASLVTIVRTRPAVRPPAAGSMTIVSAEARPSRPPSDAAAAVQRMGQAGEDRRQECRHQEVLDDEDERGSDGDDQRQQETAPESGVAAHLLSLSPVHITSLDPLCQSSAADVDINRKGES